MAVQNPVMDVLNRGGTRAIAGLGAAGRMASAAANSFNRGASMALKLDQLLQEEEARLENNLMKREQMLQGILGQALDRNFRERQAKIQQQQFAKNLALNERKVGISEDQLQLAKDTLQWKKNEAEAKRKLEEEEYKRALQATRGGIAQPNGTSTASANVSPAEAPQLNLSSIQGIQTEGSTPADTTGGLAGLASVEETAYYNPAQKRAYATILQLREQLSGATPEQAEKLKSGIKQLETFIEAQTPPEFKEVEQTANQQQSIQGPSGKPTINAMQRARTNSLKVKQIQKQIQDLKTIKASMSSKKAQNEIDGKIKQLENEMKTYLDDPATVYTWADKMLEEAQIASKGQLTKQQYMKRVGEEINKKYLTKDQKALFTKQAEERWKEYETQNKEKRKTYSELSAKITAKGSSPEGKANNAVAMIVADSPELKAVVQPYFDKQSGWYDEYVGDTYIFESFPGTDNEEAANNFVRALAANPKYRFVLKGIDLEKDDSDAIAEKLYENLKDPMIQKKIKEVSGL